MRRRLLFIQFWALFAFVVHGCCLRCEKSPPEFGTLNVMVSDDVGDSLFLFVYQGQTAKSGELVRADTLRADTSYTLPSNNSYTGKAVYQKGSKKAIAIDRDEIKVKNRSDRDCADSVCYIPDDGTVDLVLKENPL